MKIKKNLKEQCFFERSKVDLLKSTVWECAQWFNSTVIVSVHVCLCAYDCGRLTLINQCRVLFRDMAGSLPVSPLLPVFPSPPVKTVHTNTTPVEAFLISFIKRGSRNPPPFILSLLCLSFWTQHLLPLPPVTCIYSLFYDEFIKSQQWWNTKNALWKLIRECLSLPAFLPLMPTDAYTLSVSSAHKNDRSSTVKWKVGLWALCGVFW